MNQKDYIAKLVDGQSKRLFGSKGAERKGQALFNALYEIDPEAADRIRGTSADPFYDDSNIQAFWNNINTP